MRRRAPIAVAVLAGLAVLVLVATQIWLPGRVEAGIEQRLEADGGEASAEVEAFPALRLLFDSGSSLRIDADDLVFPLDEEIETGVFERLDGFDDVRIELGDMTAGPLAIDALLLERIGPELYSLVATGETNARSLAAFGASRLDVPGAGLLGLLPGETASEPLPLELDMELSSADGRVVVTSGESEIAGFQTGPLASLITSAIAVRL